MGNSGLVPSVAFSPDGRRLLSGNQDGKLKLWDATTGQLIHSFQAHSHWVGAATFSNDGTHILSGGQDKVVRLWDAATGALIRTFEGHSEGVNSVAFLAGGVLFRVAGTTQSSCGTWKRAS